MKKVVIIWSSPNTDGLTASAKNMFVSGLADRGIQAEEIVRIKRRLNEILAKHTGQPIERVEHDSDRDFFIGAREAVEYGIVDEVLTTLKKSN